MHGVITINAKLVYVFAECDFLVREYWDVLVTIQPTIATSAAWDEITMNALILQGITHDYDDMIFPFKTTIFFISLQYLQLQPQKAYQPMHKVHSWPVNYDI